MNAIEFYSRSAEQTQRLGEHLGEVAEAGDLFLLVGNLGSGKTCLTQGIARGLQVKASVTSPTFILVREYNGRLPLYHIDLYRLSQLAEIVNLGLEQYLDSDGLCVIEWAEKGQSVLPHKNLLINLDYRSENERLFTFQPNGQRFLELIDKLSDRLKSWN